MRAPGRRRRHAGVDVGHRGKQVDEPGELTIIEEGAVIEGSRSAECAALLTPARRARSWPKALSMHGSSRHHAAVPESFGALAHHFGNRRVDLGASVPWRSSPILGFARRLNCADLPKARFRGSSVVRFESGWAAPVRPTWELTYPQRVAGRRGTHKVSTAPVQIGPRPGPMALQISAARRAP